MAGKVILQVVEGPLTGTDFAFDERTTCLMGRGRECGIRLPNDKAHTLISRMHCLLDINPPDIRVRDFGSLNGTEVNGQRIGRREAGQSIDAARAVTWPEVDLHHGDTIRLGDTQFHVEVIEPAYCHECDCEIPDDARDSCRELNGRFTCGECRTRFAPTHVERSVDRRRRCAACGSDVSQEVLSNRRGDYVCQECQADPQALLRHLLQRADSQEPELSVIAGYTLLKLLGRGGMGAVYLARREETGDEVALKVMLPKVAVDEAAKQRFLREISITRCLRHRNVVRLQDYGCVSGTFFFTLEFCDAGSVADLMKQHGGLLPTDLAVDIACQSLEGLKYAHQTEIEVELPQGDVRKVCGVVHRDLSPHNLFLSGSGTSQRVLVGDFGLAKGFDAAGLSGQTCTGVTAGKPCFMPRQQVIDFKFAKPEVDVWGLAASLYHMLTGAFPRDYPPGSDPWEVTLKTSAVPIRQRKDSIPGRLAEVIDRALQDHPEIPFKTAAEFQSELNGAMR